MNPFSPVWESAALAIDAALATLIILVQLVIYPAFSSIDKARFHDWHKAYMRTISYVVVPLMFAQAGSIALRLATGWNGVDLLAGILVLIAWIVTFTVSVPCHNALRSEGNESPHIKRLLASNWIRTAAWVGVFLTRLCALFVTSS